MPVSPKTVAQRRPLMTELATVRTDANLGLRNRVLNLEDSMARLLQAKALQQDTFSFAVFTA